VQTLKPRAVEVGWVVLPAQRMSLSNNVPRRQVHPPFEVRVAADNWVVGWSPCCGLVS